MVDLAAQPQPVARSGYEPSGNGATGIPSHGDAYCAAASAMARHPSFQSENRSTP
jgi:hypothetical protein